MVQATTQHVAMQMPRLHIESKDGIDQAWRPTLRPMPQKFVLKECPDQDQTLKTIISLVNTLSICASTQ